MVRVIGTKGNVVQVEILGLNEVRRMLQSIGKDIENSADLGVVKAGTFIQEEVKESIIGNRAEHKSVDTGTFANSIVFEKNGIAEGIVKPKNVNYPNGQNTLQVAEILENSYKIVGGQRRHFGNTKDRNTGKIQEIIQEEVNIGVAKNIKVGLSALRQAKKLF